MRYKLRTHIINLSRWSSLTSLNHWEFASLTLIVAEILEYKLAKTPGSRHSNGLKRLLRLRYQFGSTRLFKLFELYDETRIGTSLRPFVSHDRKSLLKWQILRIHQICNRYSRWPWMSCMTMDEYLVRIVFGKSLIDKGKTFLKFGAYFGVLIVANVYFHIFKTRGEFVRKAFAATHVDNVSYSHFP